jgi:hypothetical protein
MQSRDVLVITGIEGAENLGAMLADQVGARVEIATNRRAGLLCVRRGEFGVVVVEESLVEADPDWADQLWASTGVAIPLLANFSIKGGARLGREVKSALGRLAAERVVARRAVASEMENELKSSLTGLLLQSELALREPANSPALAPKLQKLVELASSLRERFDERHRRAPE